MAQTVGDFVVVRLHEWGVRKIFGYPGDGINGVIEALNRADGKVEFIQSRREEMAVTWDCRRVCRTARSSRATPAPARTGSRATSRCGAA